MDPVDAEFAAWSVPAEQRAGRPLIVLLHGSSGNEGDMLRFFGRLPPSYVAVSLRAPFPHGAGFSWLRAIDSDESLPGALDDAADALLSRLTTIRGDAPHVGLIGWSQGGAVALQALRLAQSVPAFVVTLGGFSGGSLQADDAALARMRPPVFWGHGSHDDVIPPGDIAFMAEFLPLHSTLTAVEYEGVGHEISEQEIDDVRTFIETRVAHP
jgi:phospholipase/carboxylesterase